MSEWISVKDRLPRYNETVLIYRPSMAEPILADKYFGWYGEDDNEWHEGWLRYGGVKNDLITHWQPLPEPPKEDT